MCSLTLGAPPVIHWLVAGCGSRNGFLVSTPDFDVFDLLLRSDNNLNGVDIQSTWNLKMKKFHRKTAKKRSVKLVRIPFPSSFQELLTLRSAAYDAASLKTCSVYLAVK